MNKNIKLPPLIGLPFSFYKNGYKISLYTNIFFLCIATIGIIVIYFIGEAHSERNPEKYYARSYSGKLTKIEALEKNIPKEIKEKP